MPIKRIILSFAALALFLGVAASSEAQVRYSMSGDMFNYCCSTGPLYSVPYGNYGYVTGQGMVTAIPNTAYPTVPSIRVKQGRFRLTTSGTYVNQGSPVTYISGTTMFTGANGTGTFAAGGGPGNFAYCRGVGSGCTGPAQGTANGIVSFTAGGNQFGGTITMLGSYWGESKFYYGAGYLWVPFSTPPSIIGASYAKQTTITVIARYTYGGATYGTSPSTWQLTGFPWTTGTAKVKATVYTPYGGPNTATTTGTDSRTPLGAGNITLVTGTMGRGATMSYAFVGRLRMQLAPRAPSMSPVGLAAAAGLMLVVVGYAARRRL